MITEVYFPSISISPIHCRAFCDVALLTLLALERYLNVTNGILIGDHVSVFLPFLAHDSIYATAKSKGNIGSGGAE